MSSVVAEFLSVLADTVDVVSMEPAAPPRRERRRPAILAPEPPRPLAIVRPRTLAAVSTTLALCRRHCVSVHPVATGRNWGYSGQEATAARQILMQLGALRTISDYDATLGLVTVEPGVTQGQLAQFLLDQGDVFYADMTAAGPDTSILGNICDRGFGNSPLGHRAAAVVGFDVALADGRIMATDSQALFADAPHASPAGATSLAPGPNLTQLFVQSNFGIVLRARIQLNRRGACERVLGVEAAANALPELVERIGMLKQQGLIPACIHIANDLRLLSNVTRLDRRGPEDLRALPDGQRQALASQHGVQPWTGFTLLAGPKAVVKAQVRSIRAALRGHAKLRAIDPLLVDRAARRLAPWLDRLAATRAFANKLRRAAMLFQTLRGHPSAEVLYNTGWRLMHPPAASPSAAELDARKAGILWYAPSLPLRADRVRQLLALAEPIFVRHDFDMLLMFTCLTDRMGSAVFNILYDPAAEGEEERARGCLQELLSVGMAHGFVPYRLPTHLWPWLGERHAAAPVWRAIKAAVDPQGMISPGRYGIG